MKAFFVGLLHALGGGLVSGGAACWAGAPNWKVCAAAAAGSAATSAVSYIIGKFGKQPTQP